jgi:hypothetical protein
MSFLSGIFGAPAAPAAPATAPAAPAAPSQSVLTPTPPAAGGPATTQQTPANPGAVPAPADKAGQDFLALFKPKPADPNAQKRPSLDDPLLTPLDPAALQQQLQTANFARAVTPDMVQKALSGDHVAFQEAINAAAREAFSAAATLSQGLAEQASRTAVTRYDGTLDSRFRDFAIKGHTINNPALTRPEVAPIVEGLKKMIATNNPHLPPAEVANQVEAYMLHLAGQLQPPKQAESSAKPGPTSFADFA